MAIISEGGFLGTGVHHAAIPAEQFGLVSRRIIVPGTMKDALKELPESRYDRN